jgi:uncharacterized protein (DUF1697 family)
MALVVLLRGVNVGGHRVFRPTVLAERLAHLGAVNVGAAGSLVIWRPVGRRQLREELGRALPFACEIMLCEGREVAALVAQEFFAGVKEARAVVRFVSVLARAPRRAPMVPFDIPERGPWQVRVVARQGRFVVGMYRRQMRAVGHLGALDRLFGVPVTTRGWGTMTAIAARLEGPTPDRG